MSDQTNRILNEVSEGEKFIKTHTSHFESLEENIRRSEKSRQRNADENKSSTINKIIKLLFLLINNFEMQARQYCAFIICSELVF